MTDYYAGIGGSSGNAGTSWALRKALPSQAYALCSAGDTVYIGPGSYDDYIATAINGSSGNLITMIGDYSGANTDGTGGVVRMHNASRGDFGSYNTIRGIVFEGTGSNDLYRITGKSNVTVEDCTFSNDQKGALIVEGTGTNRTFRRCFFYNIKSTAINYFGTTVADCADVIENCIFMGVGPNNLRGVSCTGHGGVTVKNCLFAGSGSVAISADSLPGGYTAVNVNNCIIFGAITLLSAAVSGQIVEDYNALGAASVLRTNVSTGSNSTTFNGRLDQRWFFEAINGGTLVTPFDLASYSPLVELNSGTGAPSADVRGTTVQGTYREWGPLEYDSTLDIEAGAGASVYRRVARILGG